MGAWKQYQNRLPTEAELGGWFDCPTRPALPSSAARRAAAWKPSTLTSWRSRSIRSGVSWSRPSPRPVPAPVHRADAAARLPRPLPLHRNDYTGQREAGHRPGPAGERPHPDRNAGAGGYALAPGSPPERHESGRTYEHVYGPDLCAIQTISAGERETLLRCAWSFNREPDAETVTEAGTNGTGLRPGDDFNRRGPDWPDILTGWTVAQTVRRQALLGAPRKGAWLERHDGRLHEQARGRAVRVLLRKRRAVPGGERRRPCTCYSKFAAYALLHHGGDFQAAATELAHKGYGEQDAKFKANGAGGPHRAPTDRRAAPTAPTTRHRSPT